MKWHWDRCAPSPSVSRVRCSMLTSAAAVPQRHAEGRPHIVILGCTWSVSSCSEPGLNPCHLRGSKKGFFRFLFFCSSEGKSVLVPVMTVVSCASVRMRPQLASGSRSVCRKCDRNNGTGTLRKRLRCHGIAHAVVCSGNRMTCQ
jgi:hypothetical protein